MEKGKRQSRRGSCGEYGVVCQAGKGEPGTGAGPAPANLALAESAMPGSIFPSNFLAHGMPASPRQPTADRAKQEPSTEAAAGSDIRAEGGKRAAEVRARGREEEIAS